MLLKIQSGESVHSYIDRNISLNWRDPSARFFKAFSKSNLSFSELKTIASTMGWLGCRGLNRLLHFHTEYPVYSVIKNGQNLSYSQDAYISQAKWMGAKRQAFSFCPDCIREDILTLGFPFWHRLHQKNIEVCEKHNVLLQRVCPFCQKGFYFDNHGLDVIWNGCDSRSLAETVAIANNDPIKYKRSKLLNEMYHCGFHISEQAALKVLYEKLSSVDYQNFLPAQNADLYIDHLKLTVSRLNLKIFNSRVQLSITGLCFEAIMLAYEDFDSFLSDIKCHDNALRPIDSLWGTYQAGGGSCFNYITV
ncbi:TniQ family protein [Pseudomonas sp. OV226]|uniref:TniQ family protein n=1 Tax=Pseudomonas sp. OV226 TaxID=2135588 RepID=UPI000D6CCEEF|nr:TniQ family protein [Pseudomonas sp. OV226]PWK39035.1 TniQ protein [Pseudomonas sp. OV226]